MRIASEWISTAVGMRHCTATAATIQEFAFAAITRHDAGTRPELVEELCIPPHRLEWRVDEGADRCRKENTRCDRAIGQDARYEAARTAANVSPLLFFSHEQRDAAVMPDDFHAAFVLFPRVDPFFQGLAEVGRRERKFNAATARRYVLGQIDRVRAQVIS